MTDIGCPLCGRAEVGLNDHHLVPAQKGGKKGSRIEICTNCHDQIHAVFTNNELKDKYNTLKQLKNANRMQGFYRFIAKRPYKAYLKRCKSKKDKRN